MNRKELDEAILNAIDILTSQKRKLTAVNIQEVSEVKLRLYQIYSSKHKDKLEVRVKRSKATQVVKALPKPTAAVAVIPAPVVTQVETKPTAIDLFYQLFGATLTIELKEATPDSIDDAIEDLTFLFRKSIARLQREKLNLY